MGSWVAEPSRGRESAFRDCCGRWDSQAKWERWRDKGSHQRKHRDIQRGRENSLEADRARGKKKVRGDLDGVLGVHTPCILCAPPCLTRASWETSQEVRKGTDT